MIQKREQAFPRWSRQGAEWEGLHGPCSGHRHLSSSDKREAPCETEPGKPLTQQFPAWASTLLWTSWITGYEHLENPHSPIPLLKSIALYKEKYFGRERIVGLVTHTGEQMCVWHREVISWLRRRIQGCFPSVDTSELRAFWVFFHQSFGNLGFRCKDGGGLWSLYLRIPEGKVKGVRRTESTH